MYKRAELLLLIAILLVCVLSSTCVIHPVQAIGTIYIRADGLIDPPTAPISRDGSIYVLTANIASSADGIVIERNGSIFDGAGYTIQGTGTGNGIALSNRSNVTIIHMKICNFASGIALSDSSHNEMSGNNLSNNIRGIDLWASSGNTLSCNTMKSNSEGVYLCEYSSNNTLVGNTVTNSEQGITLDFYCDYSVLSGNNLSDNNQGINLFTSLHCVLSHNTLKNNQHGMVLADPAYEKIFHNNFMNNTTQAEVNLWCSPHISWHNGFPSGGNYWSDYEERYPNATEIGASGIWNTPYTIKGDENSDPYPLMHVVEAERIVVPDDYPRIQEAVNHANEGDTVFVRNGTYFEHIAVTKPILLLGENVDATVIDGNGTGTVLQISADNVTVANFTIRNGGRNLSWLDSCVYGHSRRNVLIENNKVMNATIGILFYGLSNSTMRYNVAEDFGAMGLHLDGGSTHCTIADNIVINSREGLELERSADNCVKGNQFLNNNASMVIISCTGRNVFRENIMNGNLYNLIIWGTVLGAFQQDIDTSNTVNNKTVYYIENSNDLLIDQTGCPDLGYLAIVNCTNLAIRDIDLSHNKDGLLMAYSTKCSLTNITIAGNHGSLLHGGLTLYRSDSNWLVDSSISNNTVGICLCQSNGNHFYHNSFVNIDKPVISGFYSPFSQPTSPYSMAEWDNGYPSGGNYWSDYLAVDMFRGSGQNTSGSDGIGDSRYVIDVANSDKYPLVKPWRLIAAKGDVNHDGTVDILDLVSISTVYGFHEGAQGWNPEADLAQPYGIINMLDAVTCVYHYGEKYP